MPPLIKCIHIAAHKAAGECEKEKAKKNVHLYWPQNQGIAAQSVRAAGKVRAASGYI